MLYFNHGSSAGCELSKDKKEYSWDSEDEELSKADIEQKLVLSQVQRTYHVHPLRF